VQYLAVSGRHPKLLDPKQMIAHCS
jgi:hypothetical protein